MASSILRGGSIIDGLGGPRYRADVLLSDGRIAAIMPPGSVAEGRDIDISGLVVAPGFIDMHAHSDLAVLADPAHVAKAAQGVTLEVVGQDGLGYSPVTEEVMAVTREQIAGWNGTPDLDYAWRSVEQYLQEVDKGAAVNVAVLVPHGTVRMIVMGTQSRGATEDELEQIRDIVAQGLREGAVGMSTGLTYTPGMYASDKELIHALAAVREIGGYYCPHHRNYGSEVVEGYQACFEIAREAQVPLHLAHCHVNFPQNKGRAAEVLTALDRAIAEGTDITLDAYPYLAGATYLAALLPSWAHEGGREAMTALLNDPQSRVRLLHEIETLGSDGHHGVPMDWETIVISSTQDPLNGSAIGKTVAELAIELDSPAGEVFLNLLLADDFGAGCLVQVGNEENVQAVMRHQAHTVGSDGILAGERPHPRGWGTFPRFLGHYVRELGILSLEEAVLHATSRPARRLGLHDRGVVAEGNWADLVVFDPERIASRASYDAPKINPDGIHYVFVNGEATIENGIRTSAVPGKAIRRT
jgi:N-acyl-D-amino-acid deacylase